MKKYVFLFLMFITTNAFAVDQWVKTNPAGTDLLSTIDTTIGTNNEALDRLLTNYRTGANPYYTAASTFSVSAGELVLSNSGGTVRRLRKNTSTTNVTWSDIDTGAEANSTVYYVWATADVDEATWRVKISTSSSAPSGITYYRLIGKFYNNSSGDIEMGGIIVMYSGFLTTIPQGYVICDGTLGTPDLSDRFVIGTKTGSTVGAVGTSGGDLTGSGSVLRTATAADSTQESPDGSDGSNESEASHSHKYPKYYALAFIMKQGVE